MRKVFFIILLFVVSCATMKQANEFYEQKNYQAAIAECKKELAKDSLNADAYLLMGKSYRELGDLKQARMCFEKAMQAKPNTRIAEQAESELIDTKLMIANQAAKEENFSRAISEFKEILQRDSTNIAANLGLAKTYEANGWLVKARKYYLRIKRFAPDNADAQEALARIDSLMKLADENFVKGKANYLKGRNYTARKYLKKALKYQADHREASYYFHMAQGKIYYKKGGKSRLWDAIEHFGKAMMIHENSAEPHYYMALAYEKKDRNEFDNAISEYKIALEKEPDGKYARRCKRKIRELTARRDKLRKFWGK